jgi:divalent metal cation (Fe/Co/Zn/Cd) transporter
MDVVFEANLTGSDLAETVERLEERIRNEFPAVKRIFIETKSVRSSL